MKTVLPMLLASVLAAAAAEQTVGWNAPTNNADGSALIDLTAYRLTARRCDTFVVMWTSAVWRVNGRWTTNKVVRAIEWVPGPTQETFVVAALTNAPNADSEQAASFTNLANNRVYAAHATSINSWNVESEPSSNVVFGVGRPAASAVQLKMGP